MTSANSPLASHLSQRTTAGQSTTALQILDHIRAAVNEAWQAYIDQGIKYYGIPVQVRYDTEYVSDEAFDLLVYAYDADHMLTTGSTLSQFRQVHKFFAGAERAIRKCLAVGRPDLADMLIAGAEVYCDQVCAKVAKLNWAMEKLVAAHNTIAATDQMARTDLSVATREMELRRWAEVVRQQAVVMAVAQAATLR
ncbi:hypothetical protein LTR85_002343 [Meristemomyces frigidus]|nr:hypothetical protein LTR85_002343 [Meristemomyces frigidus]